MNDMQKLELELREIEEQTRRMPETRTEGSPRVSGSIDSINAFFFDEKLTGDVSYECFIQANGLSPQESKALYNKFAQRRFSAKKWQSHR
jgi:hypothetical protein